jgi:hypothetical protein
MKDATDLSSIESLRSWWSSVQILLYWLLASVSDRSGTFSPPAESTTETKKHISLTPRNGRQSIDVEVWRDRVPGHLLQADAVTPPLTRYGDLGEPFLASRRCVYFPD